MRPAFWLVLGLVSCTPSSVQTATPIKRPPPPSEITFHVDQEFTKRERGMLAQAASDLDEQSGHHVRVRFLFDLDYTTQEGRPPITEWYLSRIDSIRCLYQTNSDDMFLGLTVPRLKQTLLVYDRLGADNQFRHTAMHEFMHAFGVPHLPCPEDGELGPPWCKAWAEGRIMRPSGNWNDGIDAPTCMNAADADALAKVTKQPREDFRPCL